MLPRRLRSLRCVAIFVIILFILGCMAAIFGITDVANLGGPPALFGPYRRGIQLKHNNDETSLLMWSRGHKREGLQEVPKLKFLPTVSMKPGISYIEEKQHRAVETIREILHNASDQKIDLKRNLGKHPGIGPKKKKKVVRSSYLNNDVLKDGRDWKEIPPNYAIHAFYYPWYGDPVKDHTYLHWNHEYLPHWNREVAKKWPTGVHQPPDDIGSTFYPQLGCYSSKDEDIIRGHMRQMRSAGIGVLVLSWYPPGQADGQGKPTDKLVSIIMDIAGDHDIKVAFHSEPYDLRTEETFAADVRYIIDTYGSHPAMYRHHTGSGLDLPMFYIYDSYLVNATNWAELFRRGFSTSLRGTKYDGIFLGLLVEKQHRSDVWRAGFDGFYTYFASSGFTHGSTWSRWKPLQQLARQDNFLFVPSVGPGYVDTRVRPWNGMNTKWREHGSYYDSAFRAALAVKPTIISITSFNEWHEGTQIESAVPYRYGNYTYLDYSPNQPNYYLRLTRQFAESFQPPT